MNFLTRARVSRLSKVCAANQRRFEGNEKPTGNTPEYNEERSEVGMPWKDREAQLDRSSKYKRILDSEPDTLAKKLIARRRNLFSDTSLNKLELSFDDEFEEPHGTVLDHVLEREHSALVTHMVPIDHIRTLVPTRFSVNSIIHDMEEWALVSVEHQQCSIYPFRGAFKSKKGPFDIVTYFTHVADRNTGERMRWVFSHYCSETKLATWMKNWWQFPVHQFGSVVSDVEHDGDKFTNYSVVGTGAKHSRAGAIGLALEDTGIDVTKVASFAGFKDAESALVFLTNTQVDTYTQMDYVMGRSDSYHAPLHTAGKVTVAKVLTNGADYSGITRPHSGGEDEYVYAPPEGVYPWLHFWDVMNLNRDRRLHSALLFKGPMHEIKYMPLHVYDEQTDRIAEDSKLRKIRKMLWARMNTRHLTKKKEKKLTVEDYEKLWKEGRFT